MRSCSIGRRCFKVVALLPSPPYRRHMNDGRVHFEVEYYCRPKLVTSTAVSHLYDLMMLWAPVYTVRPRVYMHLCPNRCANLPAASLPYPTLRTEGAYWMPAARSADQTPRTKATNWPRRLPRHARWACRTTGARSVTRPPWQTARSCRLSPPQTGSSSTLAFCHACASTGKSFMHERNRARNTLSTLNLPPPHVCHGVSRLSRPLFSHL